ncbi:helix-turn-helix domain-containing protein [Streptomyces sp. ISL-10]|uniref:helix-turn-helix domain-containing protein n=1 Tax=Streptomyces sp. ISL-10 TaxID=2819172 RepID=UPI001BE9439A|nr:helix-turn-helix domain-containing protein [Streptomyces sp. ISL-10]MBT2368113.1 helix-turn-helix domain-containing protein [Streptomyces sp. ISL-10]
MSNTEACPVLGINRRTGKRWRWGRNASGANKAAPPARPVVPPSARSRYLQEADRVHIADRLREKATARTTAAELGRSPSTVSRRRWRYSRSRCPACAGSRRCRTCGAGWPLGTHPPVADFNERTRASSCVERTSATTVCHSARDHRQSLRVSRGST